MTRTLYITTKVELIVPELISESEFDDEVNELEFKLFANKSSLIHINNYEVIGVHYGFNDL